MNFQDALEQTKQRQKLTRPEWRDECYIYSADGYGLHLNDMSHLTALDLSANDWEVVEEKEWQLAREEQYDTYSKSEIKKCCDLIIKDLEEGVSGETGAINIVKRRFGFD